MTERTVLVRLKADVSAYQANLARAKQSTQEFGREITGQGKTARADVEAVGRSALVMGGAMAIGFGKAISVGMDFEKSMSGVQAVSGATSDEMHKLSNAALAAGASTKLAGVTASDAAKAEGELVKAGVSVSDVLSGALMGSLTLGAAGQIDFAEAATIAAQAMNIFDLAGRDVTHVADVLAAASNKSATDVGALGDALKQGGLVAAQTGLSFEETVGALAAFGDSALIGSDAGTSLKTMLQRLVPVGDKAIAMMDTLGFSAYDAEGNFIGLEALAGEMQDSFGELTVEQRNQAMATLFGSDAVRGATVLFQQGAEGIRGYIEAVDDEGAAARMAAIQNNNLAGDIEALGGAFESALIENGAKANDVLRFLTQSATGFVTGFSAAPDVVQSTALGLGAIVTAGTLAIGVVGTMAPKVIAAKAALDGMGSSGAVLARNLGKIGGGMAVIGAGIGVFAVWESMMGKAAARGREFAESLAPKVHDYSGYDELREKIFLLGEEIDTTIGKSTSLNPLNFDTNKEYRDAAKGLEAYYEELSRISFLAEDLGSKFGISTDAAVEFVLAQQAAGVDILAEDYDKLAASLGTTFTKTTQGTAGAHTLAAGMEVLGSEVMSVEDQIEAFNDTLDALYNQLFGVEAAQDAFQSGLNDLPEVLKKAREEGLNLNNVLTGQSTAAIDVRGHMRGMVSDASELIAEWQEQGVTGDELAIKIALLSQGFRDQAIAAGTPAPVVDHYLGLLDQIPVTKDTTINANVSQAAVDLEALAATIAGIPRQFNVSVTATGNGFLGGNLRFDPQYPSAGGPIQRADGGAVYLGGGGFPGAPRGTDTVPAWLTPGEFVMQRSAVDRFGTGFMEAVNQGQISGLGGGGAGGATIVNHYKIYASSLDAQSVARTVRDAIEAGGRRGIAA